VCEELLGEAVNEIVGRFGAMSFHKQTIEAHWQQGGTQYRDDLAYIVVDVPDRCRAWGPDVRRPEDC